MLATRPGQTPQAIQIIKFATIEEITLEAELWFLPFRIAALRRPVPTPPHKPWRRQRVCASARAVDGRVAPSVRRCRSCAPLIELCAAQERALGHGSVYPAGHQRRYARLDLRTY